jgi:hypothetical protein
MKKLEKLLKEQILQEIHALGMNQNKPAPALGSSTMIDGSIEEIIAHLKQALETSSSFGLLLVTQTIQDALTMAVAALEQFKMDNRIGMTDPTADIYVPQDDGPVALWENKKHNR